MSEEQAENELQSNETGGFRFAVTLLVALGTVLYTVYNYFQNKPVDIYWYSLVCGLIPVALILVFGLLFYILIKGYSMEVQESNQKESLAKWASRIYLIVLLIFTMLLVFILSVFVSVYLDVKTEITTSIVAIGFISFILFFVFIFFLPLFRKNRRKRGIIIFMVFLALLLLWPTLFSPVLYSPLQGHVTVDMGGIYYKNDAPIHVLIHVTGPNTGLSIQLFQENSNHNLSLNDLITLSPERNPSKTVSGENSTLVGNALDYGTYNVLINTTNLSAGYYELVCKRQKYEKTYSARGFYLLNSSKQSGIEEVTSP